MDSNYIQQEKDSLSEINGYIRMKIKSSTDYHRKADQIRAKENRKKFILSTDTEDFWEACVRSFRKQMERLFKIVTQESIDKGTVPSRTFWYDDLGYFEVHFNEVRAKFINEKCAKIETKYDELIKECGLAEREIEKLNQAFEKVISQLRRSRRESECWEKVVFGRMGFDIIKHLLNLQNEKIRKLLPYFLTAYTCNFPNSRYFNKGNTTMEIVTASFSSPMKKGLDCAETSKLASSSGHLADVFSMSQYHPESIFSIYQKGEDGNEPEPEPFSWEYTLYRAQGNEIPAPLIRYKELAKEVFKAWTAAINRTAAKIELDGLPRDIDLKTCRALFNHYCANNRQNEPGE